MIAELENDRRLSVVVGEKKGIVYEPKYTLAGASFK